MRERRPIPQHRSPDRGDSRAAPFGQIEFLQKLPNPAISIPPGDDLFLVECVGPNGRIRAGVADDLDPVGVDPNFDRFALFIAAVIDGVDDSLFDGGEGVVEDPCGFGAVRVFDDLFANDVAFQIA